MKESFQELASLLPEARKRVTHQMICISWFCFVHIVYLGERAKSRNWLFPNFTGFKCIECNKSLTQLFHFTICFPQFFVKPTSPWCLSCHVVNEFVAFLELPLPVSHPHVFPSKNSIASLSLQVGEGQQLQQTMILQLTIDYIRSAQFLLRQGKNVVNSENQARNMFKCNL